LQKDLARPSPFDVWTKRKDGGRPPKLSREEIVEAAMRIADQDGIDALSMRRLAQELGTGTMSLYHYVQTKDELLAFVVNQVMAEVTFNTEENVPEHWRDALRAIAHRSKDAIFRHPWVLDIKSDPSNGPNSFLHFEQTLHAMRSLDAPDTKKFELATVVDEYIFGYCWHNRANQVQPPTITDEEQQYFEGLLETGDFPETAKLIDAYGTNGLWAQMVTVTTDAGRFDRNLDRLFDGFQAELDAT